ncbi:MAG: ferrous iron transport protein B [Planctomycetota bacterium]|nr:ferrous iron transport protein B [Planctomycetota bacterium]
MKHAVPAARSGSKLPVVAIAGNPNTGKTTVFNRLTGSDRKVGNYPGVTVERHTGRLDLPSGRAIEIVDVPGTYSLSARSREEEIAIQAVAGLAPLEPPDAVVLVVDATQLSRNLYIVLQVLELEVPLVVALNMMDSLVARNEEIDVARLSRDLGVPVVPMSGSQGTGFEELAAQIERVLADPQVGTPGSRWIPVTEALSADVSAVSSKLPREWTRSSASRERALALWALLSLDESDEWAGIPDELRAIVIERRVLAQAADRHIDLEVIRGRYGWIDARIDTFVKRKGPIAKSLSESIDAVLLNPVAGFAIFLVLMAIVFQALFSWTDPLMQLIEGGFDSLSGVISSVLPSGLFQQFVTGGVIAGFGSIVVFLPQILLLFLFIGLLEDTGYMARVAFLMDRSMRMLGLHGRAFVPMLSGYACAVPAILATRTMERQRDRTLTMMVIPLMTCSARLPVYTLVIGALFPAGVLLGFVPTQGLLMIGMYLFSTLMAFVAAAVLSRTLFKATAVPLILELPPYRYPHWPSVLRMMIQRSKAFLFQAGGVILVISIVLWALLTFPRDATLETRIATARAVVATQSGSPEEIAGRQVSAEDELRAEVLRSSYAGRLGHAIEPVIAPLGFDWKIGIGLIGAFAAREVFVSTMGVVYGVGDSVDEESTTLRAKIKDETRTNGSRVYTPLVGLSLMIFFALACQCMSTLAAVYRETKSWGWPVFLFVYMTVLAWVASFAVYQGGRALGFE